jgi:hypothetical protein
MPRTPRVAPGRDVPGVKALLGAWWLKANATASGRLVEERRIRVGKRRKAEENSLADGMRRSQVGLYQGDLGVRIAIWWSGLGSRRLSVGNHNSVVKKFVSSSTPSLSLESRLLLILLPYHVLAKSHKSNSVLLAMAVGQVVDRPLLRYRPCSGVLARHIFPGHWSRLLKAEWVSISRLTMSMKHETPVMKANLCVQALQVSRHF